VSDADWHDDRLARPHDALLAVDREAGFAGNEREALLLARMDVLVIVPPGRLRHLKRRTSPPRPSAAAVN